LENKEWVSSASMNSVRMFAAAAQLQDGKLLVTGGYDASQSDLKSAEMLTEEGWESNIPSLPVTIYAHCMVTVNSTTVMVIGGFQSGLGKTFYFTFGEESWTEGPELKNKRGYHSCGKIRRNKESQEMSIIVAGGYAGGSSFLSSVEILDEDSNEWQTGPELPFGIRLSQMVEDQNGGVVLIGGESSSGVNLDTLYQLPHGGQDAVWTKMEQKMQTGRKDHTAFLVPDNIVDCS
jgi:N-acetylneuraminic acid mutarotase